MVEVLWHFKHFKQQPYHASNKVQRACIVSFFQVKVTTPCFFLNKVASNCKDG